ncbi:MAG: CoA-binding protein [Candidatus Rokuibacteriota bacterium]|nr:MAG: CoA-binding protein [Candidatus Rokubacteria bacterium]
MTDWRQNLVDDDAGLLAILREAKTVAVLGAKPGAAEPAYYVPAYLRERGYRILPVNPKIAGRELLEAHAVARLADLAEAVDVVEIFRRAEHLPAHAVEILALPWRPKAVWFQLGIRHNAAAERLARAGIRVVQDRCMMPEHRRLIETGGGRRGGPAVAPPDGE